MAKKLKKSKPAKKAKVAKKTRPAHAATPKKKKSAPREMSISFHKKTEAPKVSNEKAMSASEVQKLREVLSQKRDELLAVVAKKKEEEIMPGEMEIGDEADIATRSVEKEMLFELTDSEKQTVDMIEASLRKMEKGVYGRCESCQTVIPRLRLEVMPWARYCIRCQAENEVPSLE